MSILSLKLNSTNELEPRVLSFSATKYLFSVLRSSKTVRILIHFSIKLCNPKKSKESNNKKQQRYEWFTRDQKQRSMQGWTDCSPPTFNKHSQPAAGSTTTVKQWAGPIIKGAKHPKSYNKPLHCLWPEALPCSFLSPTKKAIHLKIKVAAVYFSNL